MINEVRVYSFPDETLVHWEVVLKEDLGTSWSEMLAAQDRA